MNENTEGTQEAAANATAGAEGHGKIISIDEGRIKEHLSGVVLEAVEETLNALPGASSATGTGSSHLHLGHGPGVPAFVEISRQGRVVVHWLDLPTVSARRGRTCCSFCCRNHFRMPATGFLSLASVTTAKDGRRR
ncbi:MAG: hypothetical protein PHQ12_04315 [Chthoniobacteraceae bacterium]|nr:hypothetical protein [Chthoniobacteraceae bacterium]